MYLHLKKSKQWLISLLLPFLFLSCSEVRLIGAYDQTVDESIQNIAKEISILLIKVEKNVLNGDTKANDLTLFRDTYTDIEGQVQTLKIRTGALPKYEKVKAQVDAVSQNIQNLEALHKLKFAAPGQTPLQVINAVKDLFEISFTSMIAAQNALKREQVTK